MGDNEATGLLVESLTDRLNKAEDDLALLKKLNAEQAEQLKASELEVQLLRARLTAVALVIRP
jgi:hypothetical protein